MAFTKALYYPRIEVPSEAWLKTAILYWDEIKTIVPASMPMPYTDTTSLELFDAGVLSPLHVHPQMESVKRLEGKVLDYLWSGEADGVLIEGGLRSSDLINPNESPEWKDSVLVHNLKWGHWLGDKLGRLFSRQGEWIRVDRAFAQFYLTLLATELSSANGLGLLTDLSASDRLAVKVRLDGKFGIPHLRGGDHIESRYERHDEPYMPNSLAQAFLADLTLQRIAVKPDTPVARLLRFRCDHSSELGRFRARLADLTKSIDKDLPLAALQQRVADVYTNEVRPAIDELEDCLNASKISWILESVLKTSMLSIPSGGAAVALGMSIPQALLAGAGISLTVSAVLYNLKMREELRSNPFSYLLSAESSLG
jgi:hypothetical protein